METFERTFGFSTDIHYIKTNRFNNGSRFVVPESNKC